MALIKKPKDTVTDPPVIDMTPMIDVVFQLLIFFMIAIDLSQDDLSELTLPMSTAAVKDEPEDNRLYVNIKRDGKYEFKRQPYDLDQIKGKLFTMVDLPMKGGKPARDKDGLAMRPILIRADQASEFKHVQKVMYVCALKELKIWMVNLAAGQQNQDGSPVPAK
jgi:biopolymer transport protein ExbD